MPTFTQIDELLKTDDAAGLKSLLNGVKFEPLVKEFAIEGLCGVRASESLDGLGRPSYNSPHVCAVFHAAKECLRELINAYPEGAQLKNHNGELPHHRARFDERKECLELLLKAYPAGAKAENNDKELPHHVSAKHNSTACMELLMKAYPEGAQAKGYQGKTPADIAMEKGFPMLYAFLDPEGAAAKGDSLKKEFEKAKVVNVISTRFRGLEENEGTSWDPFVASRSVWKRLERREGVKTFNPNYDNAFLMKGDAAQANGIWLRNFRWAMTLAQKTGGRMIQVVVHPGLSDMQHAEADMAADKGIPVVRLDFRPGIEAPFALIDELHKMAQGELTAEQKAQEEAFRLAREKFVEVKKAFLALEGAAPINLD